MKNKEKGDPRGRHPARRGKGEAAGPPHLEALRVLDELEVGPVHVEPKRVLCPYQISRGDQKEHLDLIYSYEEDVFDPSDPESRNLASMVAAQVAVNYGLFFQRISFRGPYDAVDEKFIREMSENTAREIYVNKFLKPNPFLVGKASHLPIEKRKSYLLAEIFFPELSPESGSGRGAALHALRTRHAVLSSGGKDSLLTFGLLRESGCAVHPIFVNESGRHWFTALNSYRYFQEHVANTARVWTNADRLFSWMLRHFPFIRTDFQELRSDDYPIRLWTVAVFLFGVLPLLQKRQIGRILIGDEFDTTRRVKTGGIPHFDGLYDQSRFFDNALTRYYRKKNWKLSQFSILRPLSELLIQKILVERYPELQARQISCHATHMQGDRVRPCGRCEKCRRIVGMLLASGGDPTRCGYSSDQIERCLEALSETSLHQEQAGVQQLLAMLIQKKLLPAASRTLPAKDPHPEVLKLRFDPDKSPIKGIPEDLRIPVYGRCLEHARGCVKRQGRGWLEFDFLSDAGLREPYPFERAIWSPPDSSTEKRATHPYLLGELTWPEARERFKEVDLALLPVGAIEQHGPHLPLDVDSYDANYLAHQVAAQCSDPRPVVLPLIPYGVSYHHDDFSGTISVSNETLSRLVYEVGVSVARNGIKKLVILNGHGGNIPALNFAAQTINRDARIFVCVDSGETSDVDVYAMIDTPNDVHSGEIETSTTLALRPQLVKMEKARKLIPRFSNRYLNFTSKRGISWYAHTARISSSGVMGDPTKASAEKGRQIWAVMIEQLVAFVEDLKSLSLDEIHQLRH